MQQQTEKIFDAAALSRQFRSGHLEVTSEMRANVLMVKHHTKFGLQLGNGTTLAVQFGAESKNGYLQPVVRLVNLTPEKDICIEHCTDAVC